LTSASEGGRRRKKKGENYTSRLFSKSLGEGEREGEKKIFLPGTPNSKGSQENRERKEKKEGKKERKRSDYSYFLDNE